MATINPLERQRTNMSDKRSYYKFQQIYDLVKDDRHRISEIGIVIKGVEVELVRIEASKISYSAMPNNRYDLLVFRYYDSLNDMFVNKRYTYFNYTDRDNGLLFYEKEAVITDNQYVR